MGQYKINKINKNVNSMKNAKFISYSQQTYASMIVKLPLHLNWYYPIMPLNFFASERRFFFAWLHPDSFSRGGGIGGINFPDKMARLAKMHDRWSKRRQTLCVTRSRGQSNQWWLEDPLTLTLRIIGNSSHTGYPPPHRLKYLTSY